MAAPGTDALVKGALVPLDGVPIPFLYNPTEISGARSIDWQEKRGPGMSDPRVQYAGGSAKTYSFSLVLRNRFPYLGAKIPANVEALIVAIEDLQLPVYLGGVMTKEPPTVILAFGLMAKRVKIKDVNPRREDWTREGVLRKATVSITCIEIHDRLRSRFNVFSLTGLGSRARGTTSLGF